MLDIKQGYFTADEIFTGGCNNHKVSVISCGDMKLRVNTIWREYNGNPVPLDVDNNKVVLGLTFLFAWDSSKNDLSGTAGKGILYKIFPSQTQDMMSEHNKVLASLYPYGLPETKDHFILVWEMAMKAHEASAPLTIWTTLHGPDDIQSLQYNNMLTHMKFSGNRLIRIITVWRLDDDGDFIPLNMEYHAGPIYGAVYVFAGFTGEGQHKYVSGFIKKTISTIPPDGNMQIYHDLAVDDTTFEKLSDKLWVVPPEDYEVPPPWPVGTQVMLRRNLPDWNYYAKKIGTVTGSQESTLLVDFGDGHVTDIKQSALTTEIDYCGCFDVWMSLPSQKVKSGSACPHCHMIPWTYSDGHSSPEIAKLCDRIEKQTVDPMACIHTFYLLVAMLDAGRNSAYEIKIKRMLDKFSKAFAKTLFDYCACICMGEARHARRMATVCIKQFSSARSRDAVYEQHELIDPIGSAPALMEVFESTWSSTGYGGEKWAEVARCYPKYETLPAQVFVDMIINKQHNTGSIFNKPILFDAVDTSTLKNFLDFRREYDLLNGTMKLKVFSNAYDLATAMKREGYFPQLRIINAGPPVFPAPYEWGFIKLATVDQSDRFCCDCDKLLGECECHQNVCEYCGYDEEDCECGWCEHCDNKEPECTCDKCPECGYKEAECECQVCDKCECKIWECACNDEEEKETEEDDVYAAYGKAAGNCEPSRTV